MNLGTNIYVGSFVLASLLLALNYESTFAFDRPVHSIVCVFLSTGLVLLASSHFFPNAITYPSSSQLDDAIPLVEHPETHTETQTQGLGKRGKITRFNLSKTRIICALAACALCLRVELFRQITRNVECSGPGGAASIPFLVSLHDLWRNRRRKRADGDAAVDETPLDAVSFTFTRNRLRYVIPTALLMVGGIYAARWRENWGSTYICPSILGIKSRIEVAQGICIVLDALLIIFAGELSHRQNRVYDGQERPLPVLLGCIYLVVALFWIGVGFLLMIIDSDQRGWLLTLEPAFMKSVVWQSLLFLLLTVSAIKTVSHVGVLTLSFLTTFIFTYIWAMSTFWVTRNPFPPLSTQNTVLSIVAIFIGAGLYLSARASEMEGRTFSRSFFWLRIVLLCCFGFAFVPIVQQHSIAYYHPIDLLIFDAKEKHKQWVAQASGSPNLEHAVQEYQRRYSRHPPPGFDQWYEFATARSSLVIDDFDQIYDDLLPFQALPPKELRELTNQMVANPSNNMAAISIRDGTAHVQEDVLPTHRWMVEGVAKMMNPFKHALPDMDIAFNLNDECRVAVPWEDLEHLKSVGKSSLTLESEKPVRREWSADRASTWAPITTTEESYSQDFIEYSFRGTFDKFGAAVCPPDSEARKSRYWNRYALCISCAYPHTLGQFVSDWPLSGNICHQPDLEYLHGFFISPAAFKVSQLPMPVFSQSKLQGFNDILYPSAWNYIDKVKYDPTDDLPDISYLEKQNTLFWRGATSEGVSNKGGWKGMTRQRLIHLANNNTMNGVSVLLNSEDMKSYAYWKMEGTAPHAKLNLQTDVNIAEKVIRCGGEDCGDQMEELGVTGRHEFQSHWQFRYLFDMDGAGFSGRFLPFLQSNSLPFKTGLFRQWFDSRLTAWQHFVPVDIRLHGFWSTLAYFAGVDIQPEGEPEPQTVMNAHDLEGELISNEGRAWAERVLRKNDMEIYFFRLLLEWGRLTDDKRDELGFTI